MCAILTLIVYQINNYISITPFHLLIHYFKFKFKFNPNPNNNYSKRIIFNY